MKKRKKKKPRRKSKHSGGPAKMRSFRRGREKIKSRKKKKKNLRKNKAKRKIVRWRKKIVTPEKIEELVKKVKIRGFITYPEILHFFPEIEKDIHGLEILYDELERQSIEIKESRLFLEMGE